MTLRISILLPIVFLFFSCQQKTKKEQLPVLVEKSNAHNSTHLIDTEELKEILKEDIVKVIDFRKSDEYEAGHIPNALNIWRSDIEDKSYPYKGMSADKKTIEKVLSDLGIQPNDIIIIYDKKGLCDAARLWWVLKSYNFNKVKLLNGGLTDWEINGGAITEEIPKIIPSIFKFSDGISKEYGIDRNELVALVRSNDLKLIDSRTADEFSGKRQKSGAKRSGRIPGSMHIDWMTAIEKENQKFKSRAALEKIYARVGLIKDTPIVAYCHTGVRSAHTTFVLTELLGYTNVKNYDGSWSEWSYYNDLPIKKDSVTIVLN